MSLIAYGNTDELEFWVDGKRFAMIRSHFQPNVNDTVSLRGESYLVVSRNFALDYSDTPSERHMRCAVNMVSKQYLANQAAKKVASRKKKKK